MRNNANPIIPDAEERLLEKTRNLGEIHKAPMECWGVLVALLLKDGAIKNALKQSLPV